MYNPNVTCFLKKQHYPAIRSYRARVRSLLSHQHWPYVKEFLEGNKDK